MRKYQTWEHALYGHEFTLQLPTTARTVGAVVLSNNPTLPIRVKANNEGNDIKISAETVPSTTSAKILIVTVVDTEDELIGYSPRYFRIEYLHTLIGPEWMLIATVIHETVVHQLFEKINDASVGL